MDGNTRRLPPWMLAGASSGVAAPSNRTDVKSVEGKRKHEPEAPKAKVEKRQRRTVKPKERDDSEEPKKVVMRRKGGERVRREEEAKPSIDNIKSPETVTDEDLTVDDLLSFAQEYVKGEEDQTRKERERFSTSESAVHLSSQGNGTRDSTSEDMLSLLLGPFYKKSQ